MFSAIVRFLAYTIIVFSVVGCKNSIPTSPTYELEAARARTDDTFSGTPVIHNLQVLSVQRSQIYPDTSSEVTVQYGVSAHQCVMTFYRGTEAVKTSEINKDFVKIVKDDVVKFILPTTSPGDYLVQLVCVDRPDAVVGVNSAIKFQLR